MGGRPRLLRTFNWQACTGKAAGDIYLSIQRFEVILCLSILWAGGWGLTEDGTDLSRAHGRCTNICLCKLWGTADQSYSTYIYPVYWSDWESLPFQQGKYGFSRTGKYSTCYYDISMPALPWTVLVLVSLYWKFVECDHLFGDDSHIASTKHTGRV